MIRATHLPPVPSLNPTRLRAAPLNPDAETLTAHDEVDLTNRSRTRGESAGNLPRARDWKLNTVDRKWSSEHEEASYQGLFATVGSLVGRVLEKAALSSSQFALRLSGALVGLGFVGIGDGAMMGDLAFEGVRSIVQGVTDRFPTAGKEVGAKLGGAAQQVGVPLREDLVDMLGRPLPHGGPNISPERATEFVNSLQPGDIVLTGDERSVAVSGLTIAATGHSSFTHALIYEGDGISIEATVKKGVAKIVLEDVLSGKQHAVALRPAYGPGEAEKAVAYARQKLGKGYDFKFKEGNDAYYCSELVHSVTKEASPQLDLPTFSALGRQIVIPNDFVMSESMSVVDEAGRQRSYIEMALSKGLL